MYTKKPKEVIVHRNKKPSESIQNLIQDLNKEFSAAGGHQNVDKEKITKIMSRDIDFNDLKAYVMMDPAKNYTRNLIYENKYYALILLCWNPHRESCIHAHGGSSCWAKCVHGELFEAFYDQKPGCEHIDLKPTTINKLKVGDLRYIDDSIGLHAVGNNTDSPGMSLHLYAPAITKCIYYCSQTGKKMSCTMCYYSKFGEKIIFDEIPSVTTH